MTREILRLPSKLRNQTAAGTLHKASLFHVRRRRVPYPATTSRRANLRLCGFAYFNPSLETAFPQTRLLHRIRRFINFLHYLRESALIFQRLLNCSRCTNLVGSTFCYCVPKLMRVNIPTRCMQFQ